MLKPKKSDIADANWTYVNWVVSFAEEFTKSAALKAQENGVVLINGRDFCKMLIATGLDISTRLPLLHKKWISWWLKHLVPTLVCNKSCPFFLISKHHF